MPGIVDRRTVIMGCRSVGKPGYGRVLILTGLYVSAGLSIIILFSPIIEIFTPISFNLK